MRGLRLIRRLCAFATAGAAVAAIAAPSASAGLLGCGPSTQAFAAWDDDSSYFLVPNGGFEGGSSGWTLGGGAKVVAGNERFALSGPGKSSLLVPPGGSALGPKTCVTLLTPHARMMLLASGSGSNRLNVQVIFYGLLGNVTGLLNYSSMSAGDYRDWYPSAKVPSALALPLATAYCRVKITVSGSGSSWNVDDVYEDPWVSGIL